LRLLNLGGEFLGYRRDLSIRLKMVEIYVHTGVLRKSVITFMPINSWKKNRFLYHSRWTITMTGYRIKTVGQTAVQE